MVCQGGNLNTAFGGAGVPEALGGTPALAANATETAKNIAEFGPLTGQGGNPFAGGGFDVDTVRTNLGVNEAIPGKFTKTADGFEQATKFKPAGNMELAKTFGSPIASMGLGGLEQSDFMVKPDFNDPRDKYDPRSKLDLSRDTGISEAMSRDTGLRLLAKGGSINEDEEYAREKEAYDNRLGGFLTNITTPPPGTAKFAREMQEYHRKRNTEILGNPRDYTRAERMEAAKSLQGSGDTQYFNDVQK